MRPVALLQHDQNQRPGLLLDYLNELNIPSVTFMPDEGDEPPDNAKDFSGIVLLGSQHSVNEPLCWITREVALIQSAMSADIPVLGHCFGGQLMAKALGAPVQRNAWPNIGWSHLRATPHADNLFGSSTVPAFNWHYETFGIPQGAQRLLFGQHCLNKGFRYGKHLAFQCHFEVTESIIKDWCDQSKAELQHVKGPAVQSIEEIMARMPYELPKVRRVARQVYQQWASGLPTTPKIGYACTW